MMTLWKGLVIGVSIAAPVGPIGLLCIRRAMAQGRLAGFVSGLGAATADAAYGVVAALGLGAITSVLIEHERWLRLGGGVFLVWLGLSMLRAPRQQDITMAAHVPNLGAAYASTLLLTLANPMTILAFVGIFAGVGGTQLTTDAWSAGWLVAGVFLGSAAWWLLLSAAAGWLGAKLAQGGLRWVNLAAGVTIAGFGAWQLAGLL